MFQLTRNLFKLEGLWKFLTNIILKWNIYIGSKAVYVRSVSSSNYKC
jgi:hypothetical protein